MHRIHITHTTWKVITKRTAWMRRSGYDGRDERKRPPRSSAAAQERGCGMVGAGPSSPTADACGARRARQAPRGSRATADMVPIPGLPATIARGMAGFRALCGRRDGVAPVSRDVSGLVLSPNQTWQGLDARQVWDRDPPSRRARPAAVCEAGGESPAVITRPRVPVARDHHGRGREVISRDGTLAPHARGRRLFGLAWAYADVPRRTARVHPVSTAVGAPRPVMEGLETVGPAPQARHEENAEVEATSRDRARPLEAARKRSREVL